MDGTNNTIAGWVLAGAATALGLSIVSGKYYHAGSPEAPEEPGFFVEGGGSDGGAEVAAVDIGTLMAAADADAGAKVFAKCTSCHSIEKGGANGIGPNLYGVMGKGHGAVAGFAYSEAISGISEPWGFENMSAWLKSPRRYADGTKMTFAGLGNDEDRANVIAYLNQNSDSPLPLPAPAAPAAEGEEGEAAAEGEEPAAEGEGEAAAEAAPEAEAEAAAES
ncbi:c-type cytochrome [Alterisphingorhabdus coralli]|uniref:Cytochrome c family protein n=1 Tax=Alterisphingorhabdus coralli TaxID=3071408 RepID=A0AA97FBX2_9SPHN|nr:cytochrome c family protein [Parasphingorhabdus sp. SCSIO 66989]WOE76225.1 cytochrome c family protein [Parasphingorhabdus sp. SCSIO 66989]